MVQAHEGNALDLLIELFWLFVLPIRFVSSTIYSNVDQIPNQS